MPTEVFLIRCESPVREMQGSFFLEGGSGNRENSSMFIMYSYDPV